MGHGEFSGFIIQCYKGFNKSKSLIHPFFFFTLFSMQGQTKLLLGYDPGQVVRVKLNK